MAGKHDRVADPVHGSAEIRITRSRPLSFPQRITLIQFPINLILAVYVGWILTKDQPDVLFTYIALVLAIAGALVQVLKFFFEWKPKKVSVSEAIDPITREPWVQISNVAITAFLLAALFLYKNPCDRLPVNFDFENGMTDHWEVRWEGQNLLGGQARADTARACGTGEWSLAFQIDLREVPFDKAQIKYEADRLKLDQELSAWVFLPAPAPEDLELSCFILEHNLAGVTVEKPEWLWFQTPGRTLRPGEWNSVACRAQDFVAAQAGAGTWENPLLAGFEIRRKSKGGFSGAIYLDKVILK